MAATRTEPSKLEIEISNAADSIIAEGKTGYNWSAVDELLKTGLGLAGASRCKKAGGSGRAANVLTESNDKDIDLYLVFVVEPYDIEKFQRSAVDRIRRFPNVGAVAVADRTSGVWRVRKYLEREGEGVADGLDEDLRQVFPLLNEVGAWVDVANELDAGEAAASEGVSTAPLAVDVDELEERLGGFERQEELSCKTLMSFKTHVESQGLKISMSVIADVVACCLSTQLLLFAGPSGTGKSRIARALSEFFGHESSTHILEARRQLLGPEDVAGYFSNIGDQYAVGSDTTGLIGLHESTIRFDGDLSVPFLVVEEANLSAIEGYLAPFVHGLSNTSAISVRWRLHSAALPIEDGELDLDIPPEVHVGPFPRLLATTNVDATAHAPARKVTARGLVMLLEPVDQGLDQLAKAIANPTTAHVRRGAGRKWIGDPAASLRKRSQPEIKALLNEYISVCSVLADTSRPSQPSYRDLHRVAQYIATFIDLVADCEDGPSAEQAVRIAAENAFLHVALPNMDPGSFAAAIQRMSKDTDALAAEAASSDVVGGTLQTRVQSLERAVSTSLFADVVDFWTALS
ncbi:hypothetical protein N9Q18_01025 [bacterium]|nr:hypothetical protein [bacterium]